MNKKGQEGFSLLELIIVVVIVAVISAAAISSISKFIKQYKFDSYAANMEYLVKMGKIKALELTSNIGICVNTGNKQLSIRNIGTSRSAGICSGSTLQGASSMTVTESYITVAGTGASFDPRGLAIQSGYMCLSYNNRYAKICISRSSVRTESGAGGCSSCSS
ncbi:MAG: prepilin-type N-terminal cleavage/methylation domain-containing protein [Alphaproteobacteria bacterium]|uniref:Prepilin-type N-terminal cleavage/methylation domain-containing protein n=1 Tax=Candidatus Nitrobium versatile TaxID=2884831 RepID=A0A953M1Z6_9BACT|nr:prepilin-type N-terminal cleavage/methylation domain-containing protein [Candidatus Nitrobium versatile]